MKSQTLRCRLRTNTSTPQTTSGLHGDLAYPDHTGRLLRYRDLESITGWTERHIRRLVRQGQFPPPIQISAGRQLGWLFETIQAWINERGAA